MDEPSRRSCHWTAVCMAAAPATAITEPTERSIPAVEITKRHTGCNHQVSGRFLEHGDQRAGQTTGVAVPAQSQEVMLEDGADDDQKNECDDQTRSGSLLSSFLTTELLPSAFAFSADHHASFPVFTLVLAMVSNDGRLRDGVVVFDFCDLVAVLENLDVVGQTARPLQARRR